MNVTQTAMKTFPVFARLALLVELMAQIALANSHTWTGVGLTGNRSSPANRQADNPPAVGRQTISAAMATEEVEEDNAPAKPSSTRRVSERNDHE